MALWFASGIENAHWKISGNKMVSDFIKGKITFIETSQSGVSQTPSPIIERCNLTRCGDPKSYPIKLGIHRTETESIFGFLSTVLNASCLLYTELHDGLCITHRVGDQSARSTCVSRWIYSVPVM